MAMVPSCTEDLYFFVLLSMIHLVCFFLRGSFSSGFDDFLLASLTVFDRFDDFYHF